MGLATRMHDHLGSSRRINFLILAAIASMSSIWFLCRTYDFVPRVKTDSASGIAKNPESDIVTSDGIRNGTLYAEPVLEDTVPEPEFPVNVAVIIETNPGSLDNLVPIMMHFSNVLGPQWPVVLYTLEENWSRPSSALFGKALNSGRLQVRFLPNGTEFEGHYSLSVFMTEPWIWEQLESAHRVLLFQPDSIICSNAEVSVEDFLEWDLIGAPIDPKYGKGYNGGLTLRNPKAMLSVIRQSSFQDDLANGGPENTFEDQWFYIKLKELGAKLPDTSVAKTFSVETIYYEKPLGYHQPMRWQEAHMDKIKQWCPEVGMLIGRRFS